MTIEIITSGSDQNSYITLSEADALLLTMAPSFVTGDTSKVLGADGGAFLLEAASDLETMWRWTGEPTDPEQALQWPRRYVPKPGWTIPREPSWSLPFDATDFLEWKILYGSSTASANAQMLPSDVVPKGIKEAQALIALLRKLEGNLIGDNQGDNQGTQLGSIKVGYVNAIRNAADIHKRTSQLGIFIGDGLVRVPGDG